MEFQSLTSIWEKVFYLLIGDALSWLTRTATTKDVNSIKTWINQFIVTQQNQWEPLIHIISIINATRHTTQVNRQHINMVMNAAERMYKDVTTLYNITHSLYNINNGNTLITCATCRRSQRNAITHWGNTSFHHAPTNFIRRCTPFLQIPMYPHHDCWWTILITDRCTNMDLAQQIEIYKVFNLDVPHRNFSHTTSYTADIWT